jgi:hypothetical protein
MTQSLPNPSGSKIIGLGRLPFRVGPLEIESARGYIGRVAQIYSTSVSALGELLGLTQMLGLERGDNTEQIAYALRLEASEWRRLCYKQTNAKGQYGPRSVGIGSITDLPEYVQSVSAKTPRCGAFGISVWFALVRSIVACLSTSVRSADGDSAGRGPVSIDVIASSI